MPGKSPIARGSPATGLALVAAALIFLLSLAGAGWMLNDATPLLTTPRPDLRLPFGLAGAASGFVAARWIMNLPYIRKRRARWVFIILLPLSLGFGLSAASERLYELVSFREGVDGTELATAPVVEKIRHNGRRGRDDRYQVTIVSPFGGREVSLRIGQALFERIEPSRHCLKIAIERASNGAVRMIDIAPAGENLSLCRRRG